VDLFEVVGWVGAVLVLVAYWLVTKFGTSPLRVNALHHGAFSLDHRQPGVGGHRGVGPRRDYPASSA
jgi:hypothetical protein